MEFIQKSSQSRESRGINDLFVWRGQEGIQMGAGEPCREQSNPVSIMRQILILNPSYFVLPSLFLEEVGPDALGEMAQADFSPQ